MTAFGESKGSISPSQTTQHQNGNPIDAGPGWICHLCPQYSQCLQDVTETQSFTDAPSEHAIIYESDIPEDPTTGDAQTSIESIVSQMGVHKFIKIQE